MGKMIHQKLGYYIKNFDRFFDCFNVRCVPEAVHKRKPDLRPYRDPCDSRFTVSLFFFFVVKALH